MHKTSNKKQIGTEYTGWSKKTGTFFVRLNFTHLNFIKYRPIFKLVSLSESGEHL